jgi:hypothetical protein
VLLVTVSVADAKSPPGLPLAVTVYMPDATLATVKVALKVPPEIEQVEALTGLPDNEQAVSLAQKPEPDT